MFVPLYVNQIASSAYVLLGKKDEKVEALVMDVGQDKNYCVKSLLQGRYLIYNLWKNDLPKFKSAVHQTYPLVAAFAQPKPVPQEQVFEPTNGD